MRALYVAVVVAVAVIALAGVTADSALAAPAQQIQGYHVVRPGETLFCIGRGYHVNPWAIAGANHLYHPNFLRVGQRLAIPVGAPWWVPGPTCAVQIGVPAPVPWPGSPPPAPCSAYHLVQPGETLYRIACTYGVTVQQLAAANGICNVNYLRAYQNLCIPAGGLPPAGHEGEHGGHDGPGHWGDHD